SGPIRLLVPNRPNPTRRVGSFGPLVFAEVGLVYRRRPGLLEAPHRCFRPVLRLVHLHARRLHGGAPLGAVGAQSGGAVGLHVLWRSSACRLAALLLDFSAAQASLPKPSVEDADRYLRRTVDFVGGIAARIR